MISFRRLSVVVLALCLIWPAAVFAKGKGSLVTVNVTMVGPETIKFSGWQRLQAEYAKQFSVEDRT